uniref:Uncharacterized protein n=1 Tax=Arundo donax TaxID=35708 RepID=A0A0A9AU62_ARUDO
MPCLATLTFENHVTVIFYILMIINLPFLEISRIMEMSKNAIKRRPVNLVLSGEWFLKLVKFWNLGCFLWISWSGMLCSCH